jgi:putative peptidoglycan lipid II flippase
MKRFFKKKNSSRISLPGAASLLFVTMLIAQLLGFLRTMMVNGNFPIIGPDSTDAYFAAFKIPDFFFYVLAAGVLGVAFIPILSEHMQKNDRRGVWTLANSLMNLMAVVMFVIGIFIFFFAEQLMHVVAPNLSPEQLHNATMIMKLIAFNPLLFTLSGILTSAQQVFGRFFFFAVSPIVYNVSIIASIFIFKDSLGLIGLGVGALIGAFLQFGVALIGVKGLSYHWQPKITFKNVDFIRILKQLPARSLDQGIDSINSIVETNRARALGEGFVSAYENAFTLHTAPILLVGASITTAAFPRLSERVAQGRPDLFRKDFRNILRVLMWLALPIIVLTYFTRGYLARLIFKRGSPEIALILGFLAFAIFFRIIYSLLSRYFYAHKDTVTPLIVSVFAIALNIILVFALARSDTYGAAGLAMAQSIVAAAEVFVIGLVIVSRDRKIFNKEFWNMTVKLISVTGFTIVSAFIMISLFPLNLNDTGFFVLGGKLGLITLVVFSTHIIVSSMYGFEEGKMVLRKIKNLVYRPIKIQ